MIGELLILAGSLLILVSAVGAVRFTDVFARMHSLTKASTLGLLVVLLGAAASLSHPNDITSLVLAAALQLLTSPVSGNLVSRSTYLARRIPFGIDTIDELAEQGGIEQEDPTP